MSRARSADLLHGPHARRGELPARLLEMGDNLLDDPGQIGVHPHRIIAMDAGDEVGALPDVDTVLFTPLDPLVIGISRLHESPPGAPDCLNTSGEARGQAARVAAATPVGSIGFEESPMTTVTLQMPDEVFAAMREDPAHFGSELRLAAAMNWYRRGAISQEVAASVAGLDRTDFLLALARHGEDSFHVNLDELAREIADG